MGGMLHFRESHGIRDGEPTRGVRILDIDGLRDHVDENPSETLAFDTVDGTEYPRYEYLHGLYYQHHDKPISEPYFIDNVYPDTYDDLFAGISEYTEPFVVLAAQSFLFSTKDRYVFPSHHASGSSHPQEPCSRNSCTVYC
jgi:hypothetical protein